MIEGGRRRARTATKGDLRERAILAAAEAHLARGGPETITVESLATATGITRRAGLPDGEARAVATALVWTTERSCYRSPRDDLPATARTLTTVWLRTLRLPERALG